MFDTIILLSSALEREIFMTVLSTHNPSLTIIPIETLADLNALEPDTLAGARLLAFVTGVIVPAAVLDQLGFGAYNFHPGPPAYPGFAPAHFALYQRANEFGATAHVMAARVDEGPIVGVEIFSIPPALPWRAWREWPMHNSPICSGRCQPGLRPAANRWRSYP